MHAHMPHKQEQQNTQAERDKYNMDGMQKSISKGMSNMKAPSLPKMSLPKL